MHTLVRWLLGLSITVVLVGGARWLVQAPQATAQNSCAPDWAQAPAQAERDRCARWKEAHVAQAEATEQATVAGAASAPTPETTSFRPVQITPTADDLKIEELPLEAMLGGPREWQDATSIWRVSSVANATGTMLNELYVFATPGTAGVPVIQSMVLNSGEFEQRYAHRWLAPQALGTLTITAVSAIDGRVSFTSSAGQAGTLDLKTGRWSM